MSARTFEDAFNLLCLDKIGSGVSRDVYTCRLRDDLVVKVETSNDWRSFSNAFEMRFWNDHQYAKDIAKWLAPCRYMSPDGRLMLQQRVRVATADDTLPEKLPSFLTDIKRENFGWFEGRLVCFDYAATIPNPNMRLRKANW